jgi:hypothetical protein
MRPPGFLKWASCAFVSVSLAVAGWSPNHAAGAENISMNGRIGAVYHAGSHGASRAFRASERASAVQPHTVGEVGKSPLAPGGSAEKLAVSPPRPAPTAPPATPPPTPPAAVTVSGTADAGGFDASSSVSLIEGGGSGGGGGGNSGGSGGGGRDQPVRQQPEGPPIPVHDPRTQMIVYVNGIPEVRSRMIPVITSDTQTACTLPDGRPGVLVARAPVRGAPFETVCADRGTPAEPDAIVLPRITVQQALDHTAFPNITARFDPGPDAGLVGYEYLVYFTGVSQPVVSAPLPGVVITGRAEPVLFEAETDTDSALGSNDPDGYVRSTRPGSVYSSAGSLVWQTSGMKEVRITTTWRVVFTVSYPGFGTDLTETLGPIDVAVQDVTVRPMYGTVTTITYAE